MDGKTTIEKNKQVKKGAKAAQGAAMQGATRSTHDNDKRNSQCKGREDAAHFGNGQSSGAKTSRAAEHHSALRGCRQNAVRFGNGQILGDDDPKYENAEQRDHESAKDGNSDSDIPWYAQFAKQKRIDDKLKNVNVKKNAKDISETGVSSTVRRVGEHHNPGGGVRLAPSDGVSARPFRAARR